MENTQKETTTSWLERLREESWEAELLISAVAIFGTLKLFLVVDWVVNLFIDSLHPDQYLIGYAISFGGLLATSILTTMFVIHFALRTYWVGLVGLNSVFPDYGLEDSVYSEIYTKKILKILPKLKETVSDVDELCSVIYSAASFMVLIYLYFSITGTLFLFLYNALSGFVNHYILMIPMFLVVLIMILQVGVGIVANLKKYKQNETWQTWYFYLSKWGSIIILGPLYKYLLQISMTFASNYKKKKSIIGLVVVFIVIGFAITIAEFKDSKMAYLVNQEFLFDDTKIYHEFYASKSESETFLLAPQIESDITDLKVLPLFVPVYSYERRYLESSCGEYESDDSKSLKEKARDKRAWYLNCYNTYHEVYLNGQKVDNDFIKYNKPASNQFGIISYLNLENAKTGKNTLRVVKKLNDESFEWTIPFQYISY